MFGSAFGGGFGPGFGPFGSMFSDPFFSDPFGFGHMERMMDPHFGVRPAQNQGGLVRSRTEPVIEEVHGEHDYTTAGDEGIVEEPDDDVLPNNRPAKRQETTNNVHPSLHNAGNTQRRTQIPVQGTTPSLLDLLAPMPLSAMHGQPGVHQASSYSFSTTTFSSSNRNGITYQSTQTARSGPGGVREVQSSVVDGRTGEQSMTITRGLADKERTVTRARDATGRVVKDEVLKGINQGEAERFEAEWMDHAERSLGGLGGSVAVNRRPAGTQSHAAPLQLQAPPPPQSSSQRVPGTSAYAQPHTHTHPSASQRMPQPSAPATRSQPPASAYAQSTSQQAQPAMQRGAPASSSVRMRAPEQRVGAGTSNIGVTGRPTGGSAAGGPGARVGPGGGYAGGTSGYAGDVGGYAGGSAGYGDGAAAPYMGGGGAGANNAGYGAAARPGYNQQGGSGGAPSYFNTGRFA